MLSTPRQLLLPEFQLNELPFCLSRFDKHCGVDDVIRSFGSFGKFWERL